VAYLKAYPNIMEYGTLGSSHYWNIAHAGVRSVSAMPNTEVDVIFLRSE
jgi:hypothetical protein